MSKVSDAEEAFLTAWSHLPVFGSEATPKREYRFHHKRLWRFDFAWPSIQLAVEIDGRGRHHTVVGFRKDCEKINTAITLGWRVLRFPATDYKPSKSRQEWPRGAEDWAHDVLEAMQGIIT